MKELTMIEVEQVNGGFGPGKNGSSHGRRKSQGFQHSSTSRTTLNTVAAATAFMGPIGKGISVVLTGVASL